MQEQEQNRSEPATPFKLSEARKRGQVAKSLDVNSLFAVCALMAALVMWGALAWQRLAERATVILSSGGLVGSDAMAVWEPLAWVADGLLVVVLPFALMGMALAVLSNLLQTGPIFTAYPLKPQIERINPVAGFKRVFNKRMLFEAVKSVLKLAFFGAVAAMVIAAFWIDVPVLYSADFGAQAGWVVTNGTTLLFRLALALAIVAVLDLAFVRWQYAEQMKMSKRELREEVKRREGDPQVRARIRQLQRENRQQSGSLGDVGDADVLITNPEHYAVALVYRRESMSAPRVVAKGRDLWAAQLRRIAREHAVPVFERKGLARLLYREGTLGQPIPRDAFEEVARLYGEPSVQQRAARLEMKG